MSLPYEARPNVLDFTQPFDGKQTELAEAEKLEAASLFKAGMQDVFLKHIGRVRRLDGAVAFYPYDYSELELKATSEDGTRLRFSAKSFDTQTEDPFTLDVSENQSSDQSYRHVRYSLDASEDEVRRFDMNHKPLPFETRKALGKLTSGSTFTQRGVVVSEEVAKKIEPEVTEATKEELAFVWDDEFKRREVEKQLGLNDQPVSPDEVRTLLSLLERAESMHS